MDNRLVESRLAVSVGDTQKTRRTGGGFRSMGPLPERRCTIGSSSMLYNSNTTRSRNMSGGSEGSTASSSGSSTGSSTFLDNQYSDNQLAHFALEITPFANNSSSTVPASRGSNSPSSLYHRSNKLDRLSDNDNERSGSHRSGTSSRYKTELCRPFEESGSCKYGDKCQFAHGYHELRNLSRHPKYKTEPCRTFHTIGFCPYGPRCHFIHEDESKPTESSKTSPTGSLHSSGSNSPSLSPSGSDTDYNIFSYQSTTGFSNDHRHLNNALTVNTNYSSNGHQSLERQFTALNLNRPRNSNTVDNQERDIFSDISFFCEEELDNQSKQMPHNSTCNMQSSRKLDNFPSFTDSSLQWPSTYGPDFFSQVMCPVEPFHHSPIGSNGSTSGSSSGSDCGGSTENLSTSGFSVWQRPVAIGQY